MEAGFGNQTGRWTYRKAGPVVYAVGVAHRKEVGYLVGLGNKMARSQGGAERSGRQSKDIHASHLS